MGCFVNQHPARQFRVSDNVVDMVDILLSFEWFGDDKIVQTKNVQNHIFWPKKCRIAGLTVVYPF